MRFRANNLVGSIPDSIGTFTSLNYLILGSNHLTGSIPASISQLTQLQILDFSVNNLSGPVPDIGNLLMLSELYLSNNHLTSLPSSITQLLKLTVIDAENNNLTGSIPTLNQWAFLTSLFLGENQLSGTIPDVHAGSLLQAFSVGWNELTGTIPESFGNAQNLFTFIASNNSLSGTLPSALSQLPLLWILHASNNKLTGQLPEFGSQISIISLGYNQFYGNLPNSLFLLPNTTIADFAINHINGTLPPLASNFPRYDFSCNDIQSPLCPDCGPCELCGDGYCDLLGDENCATCPQDCGAPPCGVCGDGVCQASVGETCTSCYQDCGLCAPPSNKKCPGNPECNGKGTCLPNLICSCNEGFTGPACESPVTPVIVTPNPGNPTTTIGSTSGGASFEVNIKQLVEYDPSGSIVKQVNFTSVPLNLTESDYIDVHNVSLHNWTYSGAIPGAPGAIVVVTVILYRNATTVEFANQSLSLTAQTTKYTLAVREWPFTSARNKLGVVFAAQNSQKGDVCVQSQDDTAGNVQWIKLILPSGEALYAQFSSLLELDSKIIYGTFATPQDGEVELIVPHFWNELVVDPNFSLLVTDLKTSANECFKKNKLQSWAIALIAVLGTFGTIAVILGGIYLNRKIKQIRLVKEAKDAHGIADGTPSSGVGMVRV